VKNFIAILRSHDEGCDYTVGCGVKVIDGSAPTAETFLLSLIQKRGIDDDVDGDCEVDYDIEIMEVVDSDKGNRFKAWLLGAQQRASERAAEEKRAEEEAQFERLRKRLGK
jgi:hypothetical protein